MRKQLQLKSREAQIDQLQTKLNTAASNREFNLLKEQIAADKQANSVLSDEILEAMDEIDGLEIKLKDVAAELENQKRRYRKTGSPRSKPRQPNSKANWHELPLGVGTI